MPPALSILIPSIPSRVESHLLPLFRKLLAQAEGHPVEVLALLDNKCRSIGRKRQALMDIAHPDAAFCCMIDDDDDVADEFVSQILLAIEADGDADCIVFDQLATIHDDHEPVVVRFGVEFENTELKIPGGATRKPWLCCAWAARIARRCSFCPTPSYEEDWYWVRQAWPQVRKQIRIDKPLHIYRYRSAVTEAEPPQPARPTTGPVV